MTRFDTMNPILILAGGASSRMGDRDKLLEDVHGAPLLRVLAERALRVSDSVTIALRPDRPARGAALAGLAVRPLVLKDAAEGMGGTLRAGIAAMPPGDVMVVLGDLPDITADDMATLWQVRQTNPDFLIWRGATAAKKPGHPIIFAATLRPRFADLGGDTGGEAIVQPLQDKTYLHVLGARARRDLDTPEDWAAWRAAQT